MRHGVAQGEVAKVVGFCILSSLHDPSLAARQNCAGRDVIGALRGAGEAICGKFSSGRAGRAVCGRFSKHFLPDF